MLHIGLLTRTTPITRFSLSFCPGMRKRKGSLTPAVAKTSVRVGYSLASFVFGPALPQTKLYTSQYSQGVVLCQHAHTAPTALHFRSYLIVLSLLAILRSEEHTSELQSRQYLVCRLLLEKK